MSELPSLFIDIYGYRVQIDSSSEPALNGLAQDFAFFRRDSLIPDHVIELFDLDPPYDQCPALPPASVYTPRNVSYRHNKVTYVDYSGRALGIHDRQTGSFRVYSRNADLLYEATYLFLLSQSGEALDNRGYHRLHALAVTIEDCTALVLLPMGGGKSTLASELLRYPEISLLSDDSPIIDRQGKIHAFPLRLGLLPGSQTQIPADQMRTIQRMEFGPKLLVQYSFFADRVRASALPSLVFLGQRSLSKSCEIRPASWSAALRAMVTNCVIGLGLFQGLEFVLHHSPKEVLGKTRVAFSRLAASIQLLRRSRTYYLTLGRDSTENARVVVNFLSAAKTKSATARRQTPEVEPEHP